MSRGDLFIDIKYTKDIYSVVVTCSMRGLEILSENNAISGPAKKPIITVDIPTGPFNK